MNSSKKESNSTHNFSQQYRYNVLFSDVNWGSSAQANAYKDALKTSLKLVGVDEHVKNYRPQILALTGYPRNRANLIEFVSAITKKQSMLICGHVFQVQYQHVCKNMYFA